jgi:succinate dehydrogenase / fumarate reductase membrane anchor subunit
MVKTVLSVKHQGLRDWIAQRLSALFMTLYVCGLMIYFFLHPHPDFLSWQALFSHAWMKIATVLFATLLMLHSWVGMWTVFTDYVKSSVLCLTLNTLVLFCLAAYFLWVLQILWGV